MISRIARTMRSGDDGITLSELIIGMALTALALAMIGGFFASISRVTTAGRVSRTGTSIAMNATNELSRVIRTATTNPVASGNPTPAIVAGTATALTVTSFVDTDPTASSPAPTKVTFSVNASGNLVETRVAAQQVSGYWTFTGATTTRTVAGPISSTAPIFAYTDANGASVVPGSSGLTAAQEASVTTITITITAANSANTADPVQLTTTAVMTNLSLS